MKRLKRVISRMFYKPVYYTRIYGFPKGKGSASNKIIWERVTFDRSQYLEWSSGSSFVVGSTFKLNNHNVSSSESGVCYLKPRRVLEKVLQGKYVGGFYEYNFPRNWEVEEVVIEEINH